MGRKWSAPVVVVLGLVLAACQQPGAPAPGKGAQQGDAKFLFAPGSRVVPKDFLWGVATSGYQFEGFSAVEIDHTQWANWPFVKSKVGRATDFIHRYGDDNADDPVGDVSRARNMGCNTFRIGIEWARIEPSKDFIAPGAVAYYNSLIQTIAVEKGMTPIVTLLHYTYPQWIEAEGGWENPATVTRYLTYVGKVVSLFGDRVKYWITFNEPNIWVPAGWLVGVQPPGKKSLSSAVKVATNVILAHRLAYNLIHSLDRDAAVSSNVFVLQFQFLPSTFQLGSFDADWVYPAIIDKVDYVSLDYYYTFHSLNEAIATFGQPWRYPIDPAGFYTAIMRYATRYPRLPILIAENGMATLNGTSLNGWTRVDHLKAHIAYLEKAHEAGARVFGYCYWSITDNYEWGEYDARTGLYSIECLTDPVLTRSPTDAVAAYRTIISSNPIVLKH